HLVNKNIYSFPTRRSSDLKEVCNKNNLRLHLDGARIFNAIIAKGYTTAEIGNCFDTISICLSKGLGAPVGSVLLGTKELIKHARDRKSTRLNSSHSQISYA